MDKRYKLPIYIALAHIPLFFITTKVYEKPKKRKIAIKTIQLQETKRQTFSDKIIAASKTPPKKAPAVTKPKPKKKIAKKQVVKKKPKKKDVKKTTKKKKKPIKKPARKITKKTALKKSTKAKTLSPPKSKKVSAVIKNGKKDAGKIKNDYTNYVQQISAVFTDFLVLPEKGRVSLAITIVENRVIKIVPISFESKKNLQYLQENLPKLSLPNGNTKEMITFNLVFSDEK